MNSLKVRMFGETIFTTSNKKTDSPIPSKAVQSLPDVETLHVTQSCDTPENKLGVLIISQFDLCQDNTADAYLA
jgi:hypothetical protein